MYACADTERQHKTTNSLIYFTLQNSKNVKFGKEYLQSSMHLMQKEYEGKDTLITKLHENDACDDHWRVSTP